MKAGDLVVLVGAVCGAAAFWLVVLWVALAAFGWPVWAIAGGGQ